MITKLYFTRTELVRMWLTKFPQDAFDINLTAHAVGGYVETSRGFIWYQDYIAIKGSNK